MAIGFLVQAAAAGVDRSHAVSGGVAGNFIDQPAEFHDAIPHFPALIRSASGPSAPVILSITPHQEHVSESSLSILDLVLIAAAVCIAFTFMRRRWYELPRPTRPPDAIEALIPLLLFVGLYVAQQIGASITMAFLETPESRTGQLATELRLQSIVRIGMYAMAAPLLIICALLLRKHRRHLDLRWPSDRAVEPARPFKAGLLGIGGLVAVWPVVSVVALIGTLVLLIVFGGRAPDIGHQTLALLVEDRHGIWRWVMISLVLLVTPIVEELAYRGMLQTAARTVLRSGWAAIGLTAIPFALAHLEALDPDSLIVTLPSLFVLALGFGWIYERTQSIIAPIVMHGAFNLLNVALAVMMQG